MTLEQLRIVLIGTTHPGNIGSAARALKTMGLDELHLVAPERFPDPQATANAARAGDLLERARVHADLPAALHGVGLVVGLTARHRRIGSEAMDLRECARRALQESRRHPVAFLFGREHSGLSNEEVESCHWLVHIPTNPEYGVLNVAQAVQLLCYELRMAALNPVAADAPETASVDAMEAWFRHLERQLDASGFLAEQNPELTMRRLRRLFNRARPDDSELALLHGMLRALAKQGS